jgi:membrane protein YqaA with SNARE-associated domain
MKVIQRSTIVVVFFYVMMAIFGYFSTLGSTPEIVITRMNIPGFERDYFQILAACALMVVMVGNCVTNYMPFKNSLYFMCTGQQQVPQKWNIIITTCFWAAVVLVSIVFPNVTKVLGIFGGITSVNICYLIPVICYIKLRHDGDPITNPKNISAIIYFSFLCLLGWLSVIASILLVVAPDMKILQNCYQSS